MNRICSIFRRIKQSDTIATIGVFASANTFALVLSGIGGILQARWVSPEVLGEFHKYGILTSYLGIGTILVEDGLSRQFPYLMGKGLKEEAIKVAAAAKFWYVMLAVIFGVLMGVLALICLVRGSYVGAAGWGAQCVAIVSSTYGIYLKTIYRRSLEFKRLSYNTFGSSIIGFLALIAVKLFGFYGLALKSVLSQMSSILMDAHYLPMKIKASWDRANFIQLTKISIPLSLEGYIRTSFMTATFGYFVVHYCGARSLGIYGVAMAFEGFAMVFVKSLTQIFDVKMTNQFGKSDCITDSVKYLIKPTLFGLICSVGCAVALCSVIGPFIRYFAPKYTDAIKVVYILAVSMPIGALMMPTRMLRVALKYKCIYSIAGFRVLALLGVMQLLPHTINWFAAGKMFVEILILTLSYGVLICVALKEKRRLHGK